MWTSWNVGYAMLGFLLSVTATKLPLHDLRDIDIPTLTTGKEELKSEKSEPKSTISESQPRNFGVHRVDSGPQKQNNEYEPDYSNLLLEKSDQLPDIPEFQPEKADIEILQLQPTIPELQLESAELQSPSIELQPKDPDVIPDDSILKSANLDLQPEHHEIHPEFLPKNIEVNFKQSDLQTENPKWRPEISVLPPSGPEIQPENVVIESQNIETQPENTEMHPDNTEVQSESLFVHRNETVDDALSCKLRQTMAWRECGRKVACEYSCKTETDCTFPYCNSLGKCECSPAFCSSDRMCYFFRVQCRGKFVCRNNNCYCD